MPLVAHSKLPTFSDLRNQGHEVLTLDRAVHQDIRELHIGFLNMMPDAALRATERQFIRLVGSCNRIAQFFVYPFSLPTLERSAKAVGYIDRYYSDFESLRDAGLDALIITGANVANPRLENEAFWAPLMEVVDWAWDNVASMLCSCLATHAVDVPHSRYNDISRTQLEAAGLVVLAESAEGGVHMAASPDQFRVFYMQGHPEYDANSLLKEYRRELYRYANNERDNPPPLPENYFAGDAKRFALGALEAAARARETGAVYDDTLETEVEGLLDNTWGDTAKAIINNWLGLVYGVTNLDRKKQFMPGVDPGDPLSLKE
jgi:homoserine O-succinyltransferase